MRGRRPLVPRVAGPAEAVGTVAGGPTVLGPGTGDNAAAALGLAAHEGDVVVSIGTSGVVSAVSRTAVTDPDGTVAGFADATGRHLPLVATLNAARVLDAAAALLGVDHGRLAELALSAPAGADGLVLVPYLEGERTPNLPHATGSLHGLTCALPPRRTGPGPRSRGCCVGLADGIDALVGQGVAVERVLLVGGGARSTAVQELAPAVLGRPVLVPPAGEYVADGAGPAGGLGTGRWRGSAGVGAARVRTIEAAAAPFVRERYAEVSGRTDR